MILEHDIVSEVINWQINHFPKFTTFDVEVMNVKQNIELIKIIGFEEHFKSYFIDLKSFKQLYDVSVIYEPRQ